MSRFKRFAHSLISGYVLLGANMVYTLVSLPLAIHYLTTAQFGLWMLTSQIAGYMAMVDLGMSTSVARILIDKKDHREDGRYGGAVKTGMVVGVAQGSIVLLIGLPLIGILPNWLRLPTELSQSFFWLMLGQVLLTTLAFPTRVFGQILYAWQRMDVCNYANITQVLVWMVTLWGGFATGLGIYSFLLSSASGFICSTCICAVACRKLNLWPRGDEWGQISRQQFQELFSYGADMFLIALGGQLIMTSQTLLVARLLGVEAVTVWGVMTKVFTLQNQIILRFVGNTMPAFGEMMARKEMDRLWAHYRSLFITTTVLSGICAVLLMAGNSLFVSVWMQGKIGWPKINDALLALWLLVLMQQCCHNSFIACLKEVRELKYTFLVEGVMFILLAYWVLPRAGITGMLVCSVVCSLAFTWANGTYRIARLVKESQKESSFKWLLPLGRLLLVLVPSWLAVAWLVQGVPEIIQFVLICGLLSVLGVVVAMRFSLPRALAVELSERLPIPLQRSFAFLVR
ncbi:MAG: oligosaccharide flippase family protein [Verrucomicrobiota bacterium]